MTTTAIIPVYNVKKYLSRCLDSVLRQTVPFDKVIVVNDGSTDGCDEICESYAQRYNTIRLIHKENGGLVSAWMSGLKYVVTSHVCFIDSDDYVANDYHECLLKALNDDADLVTMQCIQFVDDHHLYPLRINSLKSGTYDVDDKLKSIILSDRGAFSRPIAICRWGKIMRSDLVFEYSKYCTEQISYAEDQQLMIGVFCACRRIKIVEEFKYYYQYNPTSILNSYRKDMWNKIGVLMQTIRNIPYIVNIPDFERQYNTQYLLHMSECFRNEFYNHSFSRDFYKCVLADEKIKKALSAFYSDKMRLVDKKICQYALGERYYCTWMLLFVFKNYYSFRKLIGRQF